MNASKLLTCASKRTSPAWVPTLLMLFLYRYLLGMDFNVNDSDDYDVRHERRDCVLLFLGWSYLFI